MKTTLITGGAGFIGSHVVRHMVNKYEDTHFVNLDALTYAGNRYNVTDLEGKANYIFIKGDIADAGFVDSLFSRYSFDKVIHLAAESHVDRSITDPMAFVRTNVIGTCNLLNAFKDQIKQKNKGSLFYHISTDEVYGTLGETGFFTEETPYSPNSPYSASKASSDHFVRAYGETYGMPFVISNCSNNYGPNQFPEKLIPLMINNITKGLPLPVYGDGMNTRDWLYVGDHVDAIDTIQQSGMLGETYNIGGNNEVKNINLVHHLCDIVDQKTGSEKSSRELITFVTDRPGHDFRYAIDASKIKNDLNWEPQYVLEQGLEETVDWYLNNQQWIDQIQDGSYRK
ncbi:MAG: dTDP-glucose 4,6-dehydratase [Nonlabens sp.]